MTRNPLRLLRGCISCGSWHQLAAHSVGFWVGAGRGSRTPKTRRSADFESAASASSAIPAREGSFNCRISVANQGLVRPACFISLSRRLTRFNLSRLWIESNAASVSYMCSTAANRRLAGLRLVLLHRPDSSLRILALQSLWRQSRKRFFLYGRVFYQMNAVQTMGFADLACRMN